MLDEAVHGTLEDLAKTKGVNATYVSRILRVTLLAPDIVEVGWNDQSGRSPLMIPRRWRGSD
jgi:hypothetical protein